MRLVDASFEILEFPSDPYKRIERHARLCYKSEDKITEASCFDFVKRIVASGHTAMLEFGGDIFVRFISNRGFSHELVRHRLSSYAQESTRYCNYSKGKFDGEITCICRVDVVNDKVKSAKQALAISTAMLDCWAYAEGTYLHLTRDLGCPPELARDVLPIGLKTEVDIKANITEWRHILKLRTSKRAHPRMREVMIPLLQEFQRRAPLLFDGINDEKTEES